MRQDFVQDRRTDPPVLGAADFLTGIASVGPLVPRERSLLVLVGGGYVIGEFLFTVVVGTGATQLASIRRRRAGVALALICLVGWIVGHRSDAAAYPWMGAERSLLDVGGWFGTGPVVVAGVLWLLVGRHFVTSENIALEDAGPETTGRSFGLILAGAYLFIWSGIQSAPSDGHQTLESIASVLQ